MPERSPTHARRSANAAVLSEELPRSAACADRIIVVTERGISEQGAHHELLSAGGMYSRLHQAQFG